MGQRTSSTGQVRKPWVTVVLPQAFDWTAAYKVLFETVEHLAVIALVKIGAEKTGLWILMVLGVVLPIALGVRLASFLRALFEAQEYRRRWIMWAWAGAAVVMSWAAAWLTHDITQALAKVV